MMQPAWTTLLRVDGGTVNWLATHRASGAAVTTFAATPVGVFATADGGASWRAVAVHGTPMGFATLAAASDRDAHPLLFAGNEYGVFRLRADDETWTHLIGDKQINALAVADALDGERAVFAGTEHDGVLVSTDDGAAWTESGVGLLDRTVLTLALSPTFATDRTAFAGCASGLYRSRNGAKSWTTMELPADEVAVQCLACSLRFGEDRTLLAGTEAHGAFRSRDAGRTWESVADGIGGVSGLLFLDGGGQRMMLTTDSQVFVSPDAGDSWRIAGSLPAPVMSITGGTSGGDERVLAALAMRGVAVSADAGSTWLPSNAGLCASPLSIIRTVPAGAGGHAVFVGGPSAGVRLSLDVGGSWRDLSDGILGLLRDLVVSPRFARDRSVFALTTDGVFVGVADTWRWEQVGADWHELPIGLAIADMPATSVRLVAGFANGDLCFSRDGRVWETMPSPFGGERLVALSQVQDDADTVVPVAITVSPESGEERPTIWVLAGEGRSWKRLLTLDEAGVVALDPDSSGGMLILGCGNHLYALDRRTGQGRKRRLAVASRGGGETLEPRVLGLSTIHGSSRHRVFLVATDVGLLSSHDGGSQFERWQTAHADDTVLAVATSPAVGADRRIFVATAGGALLASGAGAVDLLLVDEADRLKMPELEEIRDRYDCANFADGAGVVLIGLPGIEKRLARYPQLYSRVGFVHHFRPLSEDELRFILAHKWHEIGLTVSPDDYTDAEALAAIARITGGNFRLVQRLFSQIARILRINHLQTITQEVVEAAREQLVIGHLP